MSETEIQHPRPKRADARRNHDKLVTAAREVFAEDGTSAPLEDVADRAGVGIGTLYRHFPTRQALLEAVYVDEVEAMAQAAEALSESPPWEALSHWLHQYVGFAATKRALNEALVEAAPDSDVLLACRTALSGAGTREHALQGGAFAVPVDELPMGEGGGGCGGKRAGSMLGGGRGNLGHLNLSQRR